MTASMISQVKVYSNNPTPVSASQGSQSDAFSKVFEQNQASVQGNAAKDNPVQNTAKTENKETENTWEKETSAVEEKTTETDVEETTATANKTDEVKEAEENSEEVTDPIAELVAAQEAARKMKEAVAEILEVTPEELEKVMEELGMTTGDLFTGDNLQKLAIALTEGADEFSIMTDENLFATVKELMGIATEITEEFSQKVDIPAEDAQKFLQTLTSETMEGAQAPETIEADVVNVEPEGTEEETVKLTQQNELTQTEDVAKDGVEVIKEKNTDTKENHTGNGETNFAQTVLDNLKNAVSKVQTTQESFYTPTAEHIMDQIQEAIKLTMNQETTEMELQLHPASLGNVRVQVAAKDGVVTATFTTENEAVKAALETQMVILKDNFEAQGIKVEAVEVTVASHAFEQNLNGNNETTQNETQEKKKTARKINLSELTDGLEESDLEDDERIVADMMRKNGNTVDYMA